MTESRIDALHKRMARANRRSVDKITQDLFRKDRWEQQSFHFGKPTPAWLAHRRNLSDTPPTPFREKAKVRHQKRQAEKAFHAWHKECQRRKQRKEVMIAKGQTPGRGKKPTQPSQRKPPSRLRCP